MRSSFTAICSKVRILQYASAPGGFAALFNAPHDGLPAIRSTITHFARFVFCPSRMGVLRYGLLPMLRDQPTVKRIKRPEFSVGWFLYLVTRTLIFCDQDSTLTVDDEITDDDDQTCCDDRITSHQVVDTRTHVSSTYAQAKVDSLRYHDHGMDHIPNVAACMYPMISSLSHLLTNFVSSSVSLATPFGSGRRGILEGGSTASRLAETGPFIWSQERSS